jgi:choline-glycine betaine transporter
MYKENRMKMLNQLKLSIFIGILSAVFLLLGGILLPMVISSKLPLAFIILIPIVYLIGLFISILGLIKLFKLKKLLSQPKRKCHESSKNKVKSKSKRSD